MTTMTIMTIKDVKAADVLLVYSGKPGCMCGCRGSHRYNPAHRAEGTKRRGYAVEDSDVNMRQVERVLRVLQSTSAPVERDETNGKWFSAEIDGRVYVVYLCEDARRAQTVA